MERTSARAHFEETQTPSEILGEELLVLACERQLEVRRLTLTLSVQSDGPNCVQGILRNSIVHPFKMLQIRLAPGMVMASFYKP